MSNPPSASHAVDHLRRRCQAMSTRSFKARGISLQRCQQCLLGKTTCICAWRRVHSVDVDFVLIMHRDEVFKPTNSGRLIADVFPAQCQAFLWDRLQPDPLLLQLLRHKGRNCALLFPPRQDAELWRPSTAESADTRRATLVILDGTWKQASKMARADWLRPLPRFDLAPALAAAGSPGGYSLRQSDQSNRLSTAAAAGLCLRALDQPLQSEILLDYLHVFNEHYQAARMNRKPEYLAAHKRLARSSP